MQEELNNYLPEADTSTKTLDTKSEEDPALYQDAEGKHAKIDTDKGTEGKDKKNKASVANKKSAASAKTEDLNALFDGESLSETFKEKAEAIFEASVTRRVALIEEELNSLVNERIETEINARTDALIESVNEYISYTVKEWMNDNEIAIENGLRTDVTETFINNLRDLMVESYIDLPEDKVDAFDALQEKVDAIEKSANEAIEDNLKLQAKLTEARCQSIFGQVAHGMVLSDVEKLRELCEGLDYETAEQFGDKLLLIKNSYFQGVPVANNEANAICENLEPQPEMLSNVNPIMEKYIRTAGALKD